MTVIHTVGFSFILLLLACADAFDATTSSTLGTTSNNTITTTTSLSTTTGPAPPFPIVPINYLPYNDNSSTSSAGYVSFSICQVTKKGYVYSVVGNGSVLVASTCPAYGGSFGFDTMIYVSDSTTQCLVQDDDYCGTSSAGSRVVWTALRGHTYYIFVTGFTTYTGSYTLAVNYFTLPFSYLMVSNFPFIDSRDTSVAAPLTFLPCVSYAKYGYVYSIVGTGAAVTASLCPSDGGNAYFDTYIYVTDLNSCIVQNDDYCGSASRITFASNVSTTYYIFVTGYSSYTGRYTVAINNLIFPARPIPFLPYYLSNNTVAAPSIYFTPCLTNSKQGFVYSTVGTGSYIYASTCSTDGGYYSFDTMIYVTDGNTCVGYNDDWCGTGSRFSWFGIAGRTYYIFVTGYSTYTGYFTLAVFNYGNTTSSLTSSTTRYSTTGTTYCTSIYSCSDCLANGCVYCDSGYKHCTYSYLSCSAPLYSCSSDDDNDSGSLLFLLLIIPGIGAILIIFFSVRKCHRATGSQAQQRPNAARPVPYQYPYRGPNNNPPPPGRPTVNLATFPTSEQTPLIANTIPEVPPPPKQVTGDEAKELLLCAICSLYDKSVSLGCGHLLCETCVRQVKVCPFCKKEITSKHRIFF